MGCLLVGKCLFAGGEPRQHFACICQRREIWPRLQQHIYAGQFEIARGFCQFFECLIAVLDTARQFFRRLVSGVQTAFQLLNGRLGGEQFRVGN